MDGAGRAVNVRPVMLCCDRRSVMRRRFVAGRGAFDPVFEFMKLAFKKTDPAVQIGYFFPLFCKNVAEILNDVILVRDPGLQVVQASIRIAHRKPSPPVIWGVLLWKSSGVLGM